MAKRRKTKIWPLLAIGAGLYFLTRQKQTLPPYNDPVPQLPPSNALPAVSRPKVRTRRNY